MRSMTKLFARLALVLVALAAFTAPALAAVPSNDTFAGAKLVTLGFSEVLDTTEATIDSDDTQLLDFCGGLSTDASVWYAIDGTGSYVTVDAEQSSYSATVAVVTGSPRNFDVSTCATGLASFSTQVGTRYYVAVMDDQRDLGGNGGTLNILFRASIVPTLDVTLNPRGQFNSKTGAARFSGSYTCTQSDFIYIVVYANQRVGRGAVESSDFFQGSCRDGLNYWSLELLPRIGKFAGGNVTVTIASGACSTDFVCLGPIFDQQVMLNGGRK
jgi:hypothetical protein